jgi:hypothetical protein
VADEQTRVTGTLPAIVTAATAVVEQHGTPGAMARRQRLDDELTAAGAGHQPGLAVVIAAARWTDRYGRVGASEALVNLKAAVRDLPGGAS